MKKNNKKFILIVVINLLLIFTTIFVLMLGNKKGVFFNVDVGEMSHFYIADNLIYIKGNSFTLNRIMSLEKGKGSNVVYLSGDNIVDQKNEEFFLNFSNAFYVPIELQVDDWVRKRYENQKKKELGTFSVDDYLSDRLLEKNLVHLENYKFIAPISGKYNIWVLEESILNQNKEVVFIFDDQKVEKMNSQIEREGFLLWGQIDLSAGYHKFSISENNIPKEFIKSSEIILGLESAPKVTSNSLKFAKINPTKYIVNIANTKGKPFLLVFLEKFDKNWEIFRVAKNNKQYFWSNWFRESDFKNSHYLVNGFANAWWIDQDDLGDDEVFVVEYTQQRKFYCALLVAVLTLLFCVNYLIVKNSSLCPEKK